MSSINNIFIRTLDNKTLTVQIAGVDTVAALKQAIDSKYSIPVQMQQLFNRGELLKDTRPLAYYQLDADQTAKHPLLLTQIFSVDVYISSKVLSLCTLSAPYKNDAAGDCSTHSLCSQQSIECNSATTVTSILTQLNLAHLSHLLKICVGTASQDVRDMDRKILDTPAIMQDGVLSILFSAKWFMDRAMDITQISALISGIIEKSNAASKSVKSCTSFGRLEHQFDKTQRMILTAFEEIDRLIQAQNKEVSNASKWFKKVIDGNVVDRDSAAQSVNDDDDDANPESLVVQLSNKVKHLSKTLSAIKRKWHHKRKQIIAYLQKTVRDTEAEQMRQFKTWIASDIVQWLQYMDDRIQFGDDIVHKFVSANINGYNLSEMNDLSMKLMGIQDVAVRQLCIGYIGTLLSKYGRSGNGSDKGCHYSPYCHSPSSDSSADSDEHCSGQHHNHNACCICATNAVSTVIVPCGHAAYCKDCSREAVKYSNRCPICRTQITQIITVYKAGLEFAADS